VSEQRSVGLVAADKLRDENVKHGSVNWERIAAIIDATIKEREAAPSSSGKWTLVECNGVTQVHTKDYWVGETTDPKVATVFRELVTLHNAYISVSDIASETPTPVPQVNQETGLALCPFCGEKELEVQETRPCAVICPKCGGQLHSGVNADVAKDRWNHRVQGSGGNQEDSANATNTDYTR
jgi:hypothetical protein